MLIYSATLKTPVKAAFFYTKKKSEVIPKSQMK